MPIISEQKRLLPFTSLYQIVVVQHDTTGDYSAMVYCGNLKIPEYESESYQKSSDAFSAADTWVLQIADTLSWEAGIE